MSALSEVEREVYISQEWLDSVTTALSNVLSWRIIKLWKKTTKKGNLLHMHFLLYWAEKQQYFCYCIFEVCNTQALGWWYFSGFQGPHDVSAHQQSWDLYPFARLPWVLPLEEPGVYNFARISTVCALGWVKFGKFQAKMMMTLVRMRLRENLMPKLKYSCRHFPEKL